MIDTLFKYLGKAVNIYDSVSNDDVDDATKHLNNESLASIAKSEFKYESVLAKAKSNIIVAEVKGESSLQRLWRPALMASFGIIIAINFGLIPIVNGLIILAQTVFNLNMSILINGELIVAQIPAADIPNEMWQLLTIGIGGYIIGRSAEKSINSYKNGK